MGLIDSAAAYSRAESASDRRWALASAVASLRLPGVKARAPVAASKAAQELKAARTVSHMVPKGEPDVYAVTLAGGRWPKVAGAGRSVGKADRLKAQAKAVRAGHSGPVDVGHAPGSEHVFSKPGDTIWLRVEPRGPNRSAGAKLKREVGRVRSRPDLGIYVRDKGK